MAATSTGSRRFLSVTGVCFLRPPEIRQRWWGGERSCEETQCLRTTDGHRYLLLLGPQPNCGILGQQIGDPVEKPAASNRTDQVAIDVHGDELPRAIVQTSSDAVLPGAIARTIDETSAGLRTGLSVDALNNFAGLQTRLIAGRPRLRPP